MPDTTSTTSQQLWEARYLLARIEGELAVCIAARWPLQSDGRRIQLLRAAEDLEHATEFLDLVGVVVPLALLDSARGWSLVRWMGPKARGALSEDRDGVVRLEGAVRHLLQAMGAGEDRPPEMTVSSERRNRSTYRRGSSAKVTAAG